MNKKIAPEIVGFCEKGKIIFSPTQNKLMKKHVESLEKHYVNVIVEKRSGKRSLDQNALLWFYLKCLEHRTGQPALDIHEYLKDKLLKRWITINGKRMEVTGGTRNMPKDEFHAYIESMKNFVALPEDEGGFEYILPKTYPRSYKIN